MARLSELLEAWIDRAEIVGRGEERRRADAAQALVEGRPWEARHHALALLDVVPRSRAALALWADAAEAMLLDEEAGEALERLAAELPANADVWLRLAAARARAGRAPDEALLRAVEAGEPARAADAARLWLCDLDLISGDPSRAERWLDGLALAAREGVEALRRRVEACLDLGEIERARLLGLRLPPASALDGRAWLLEARLLDAAGDPAAAHAFERALLLETPRAAAIVSAWLARSRDAVVIDRVRAIVETFGWTMHPAWRAAFAEAEGRAADALDALEQGAAADPALHERWIELCVQLRDGAALARATSSAEAAGRAPGAELLALCAALGEPDARARMALLERAGGPAAEWAERLLAEAAAELCPPGGEARWTHVVGELSALAREQGAVEALGELATIAVDLERPVRAAVVGEFNAGKSSFVNALLGEAVAPTGVTPTTATLNHLVWAPDRWCRIEMQPEARAPERIVAHAELGAALAATDVSRVRRVVIGAPLEPLLRIELIDTPGLNAPVPAHDAVARAALGEAHVVLWLLDAAQPLKESERRVLVELRDAGVPLVVLVSKADRLDAAGPGAIATALQHVARGLEQAGLRPEAPPVAFSARLALAAPGGDATVLARSGWPEVERLLGEVVVGRSRALRERVLRRRAAGIATRLAEQAARDAQAEREAWRRDAARAGDVERALAALGARAPAVEAEIVSELAARLADLERDIRPAGRDAEAERWARARARERVGRPLAARACEALGASDAAILETLAPRLEAMLAAALPLLRQPAAPADRSEALASFAALVLDELRRVAGARAVPPALPPGPTRGRRARALAEALRG